jgi:glycosyltransferase involved in cell wall biosynthesis
MTPLRIEMVLPALPHGGMEMAVARLTARLIASGHSVGITCLETDGTLAQHFRDLGARVAVVPTLGLRTNLRAPELEAHFRACAPHVVHTHSGAWLKGAHAARRAGVGRVIHTVHGLLDEEPWHGPLLKFAASRYCDAIVAVSEPLRAYMYERCHVSADRLHLIPNGVDTARYAPLSPASTGYWEARRQVAGDWAAFPLVAHIARLVPVKNQLLLLDAFAQVVATIGDARLLIAGEGPMRDALLGRIARLQLSDHVRLIGISDAVDRWLPAMDAFVLPSLAEGTSMSVLEAMSCGVCVIASAVGGTPAVLADGAAGRLVPVNDTQALAAALVSVLHDERARHTLASEGRRVAVARYDETRVVDQYLTLYRSVA